MPASIARVVQSEAAPERSHRLLTIFPCVVSALLYIATIRFEFVYDDVSQIVLNPLVHSWKALPLLFGTDVWRFQNPLIVGSFWRPVFTVWLLLNHSVFGENTIGWHTSAIVLYVLVTYLVSRLVLRLTADRWMSIFAALVFAVHPTHLETAAWVSGTTDSLMSVFLLCSLLCVMRAEPRHGSRRWVVLSLVLFALALLTKETAILEPVLIAAYVVLFSSSGERVRRTVWLTLPFVVVSALYLVARHTVLHAVTQTYLPMTATDVLITIPSVLYFYGEHLLWPVGLSPIYDVAPVVHIGWSNFWWPVLAIATVATLGAAYVWRSRDRVVAFACALLLLPILPALYIPALEPGNFLHDRYLFLPSIGFAIVIARAIRGIPRSGPRLFGLPAPQVALVALVVLAGSYTTASQQIYWANDVLLFSRATAIAPANEVAFNNVGAALARRGRKNEAMFAFEQVIKKDPKSWRALYNLGLSYFMDGRNEEAEVYLRRSVTANPVQADPSAVLAETLVRQGKYSEAEAAITRALELMPYKPGYRRVLALSLEGQGKFTDAVQAASQEHQNHPEDEATSRLLERLKSEQEQTDRISRTK